MLDPEELPLLKKKVGHDIVTTDGTTLLGADDKAGVAEIMAAVAYLKRHPELEHAPIRVCFTVDEEVAGGADHLDIERFGARYAYTLDGAELGEIEAETFNAAKVTSRSAAARRTPGTAKGQLVNAVKLAADFVAALPRDALSPETTEEREGFVHPTKIVGRRRGDDASSSSSATTTRRRWPSTSRCSAGSPTRSASASRARRSRFARRSSTGTWAR